MVDDDACKYGDKIKNFLRTKGVEMQIVEDFDGALALFKTTKFDLILVDVTLTGAKTGLDLLQEIRKNDKHTSVYILTAYPQYKDDAIKLGATGFFRKPFDYTEYILKPLGLK